VIHEDLLAHFNRRALDDDGEGVKFADPLPSVVTLLIVGLIARSLHLERAVAHPRRTGRVQGADATEPEGMPGEPDEF
jgi:hypothetical protein